jgi:hypothetical protein
MVLAVFILLTLASCLTYKTNVEYMKPAQLDIPSDIKTIAIITKGRDRDVLYGMMLDKFANQAVRARFDLIDRENINTILREQNLFNSDEFSDDSAVEIGELSGAQATILGSYRNVKTDLSFGNVVLKRKFIDKKYKDENGIDRVTYRYEEKRVDSKVQHISFDIDIRMISNVTGSILHTDRRSVQLWEERYRDVVDPPLNSGGGETVGVVKSSINNTWNVKNDNVPFTNINSLYNSKTPPMLKKFAEMVAPYMVTELMEFEKTNGQDQINKSFIQYVKSGLYDEALELMTDSKDAIKAMEKNKDRAKHWFNLAAVYEMMSDFEKAEKWYKEAVKEDPTKRHLEYLAAIKERQADKNKLDKQLESEDDGGW